VINWVLEVEKVEDVARAEDDMGARDRSRLRSLDQRGKSKGTGVEE
jgi:hypothetical protein